MHSISFFLLFKISYCPYKDEIEVGNIDFFAEKDYSEDLKKGVVKDSNRVLSMIDNIRGPIKNMGQENKAHSAKYISNLSIKNDN